MRLQNKQSGFTLIELLVVISIIGLLSSIILAALNTAKLKAQDARVLSEMINLRTAAEMFRLDNNSYNTDPYLIANDYEVYAGYDGQGCLTYGFGHDTVNGGKKIVQDLETLSGIPGSTSNGQRLTCATSPGSYAVTARLPSTFNLDPDFGKAHGLWVCIDSSGVSRIETAETINGTGGPIVGSSTYTPLTCP